MKRFKSDYFHEYSEDIVENGDSMSLVMRVNLDVPVISYYLVIKAKRVEIRSNEFFSLVQDKEGFTLILHKIQQSWKNFIPRTI